MSHQYWLSIGLSDERICAYLEIEECKYPGSGESPQRKSKTQRTYICLGSQAYSQVTFRNAY